MLIENDDITVKLSAASGGLVAIHDKARTRECLDTAGDPMLFRLILPDGDRLYNHRDGRNATLRTEGATVFITFQEAEYEAQASLQLDGSGILATLCITNRGPLTIEEVQFPWVTGLRRLPDDAVVMPAFAQRIIRDPLGAGMGGDHRHAEEYLKKIVTRYPERLASAWMDYGNADCGLSIEGRQNDSSIMDFFVHKGVYKTREGTRRSLNFATVHPVRIRPGETWQSPPVRITVHGGDWHTAADIHRTWAESWMTKPTRPEPFAASIGWHYFFMKHQDGYARFTYADLPRMAEAALSAGCRYLMLFGWQAKGHDNDYLYGYVANEEWGGAEALRSNLEKVRAMGVEPIPFYNGTLANVNHPDHQAFGHRWEAMTRDGFPYYAGDWSGFNFDAPTTNRSRIHHEVCLCEDHRPYFIETARRIVHDYGFKNLQLDQISLKMAPCFEARHRHVRPDRAYVDGLKALLPEIRAMVREANPEGVIIGEGTNDFVGQWCDGAWTWDFLVNPEPILYSVPWLLTSTAIDAHEYGEANTAFVNKISLDLRIAGGDECVDAFPEFAAHLRGLAELRARTLPYFALAEFRDRQGIRTFRGEGVLIRAYENRSAGKAAFVLVETQGQTAKVSIESDWMSAASTIRLERRDGAGLALDAAVGKVTLTLKPYEAAMLCLDFPDQR